MYYGYGYGYDSMYFLVLLAFIFSMVAQMKVSGTFKKYAKIRNRRGLTGAQVAEQMMHNAGIYDVSVQRVAGNLTDHYDPRTKTLRLSESVYDSTSVAAVGVAAHETGHAIQHDVDATNFGLRCRSAILCSGPRRWIRKSGHRFWTQPDPESGN